MIVSCPHCEKQLKLSAKFEESLRQLEPGKKIRVKCTQCGQPFPIDAKVATGSPAPGTSPGKGSATGRAMVKPPLPPDVSWLKEGVYEDQEVVEEIPRALVLIVDGALREQVIKAVESLGYRAETAESAEEAIERMEFVTYASVILHTGFETGGLQGSSFHQHMCTMNMSKRRYIFYALIGNEFKTLYDLQALSNSANVVVNEAEIPYFNTILRKAIPDYEALFGPLMEELRIHTG